MLLKVGFTFYEFVCYLNAKNKAITFGSNSSYISNVQMIAQLFKNWGNFQ